MTGRRFPIALLFCPCAALIFAACAETPPTTQIPPGLESPSSLSARPSATPAIASSSFLWVLDDVDRNFKPPFGDTLSRMDGTGRMVFTKTGFGAGQTLGGHHSLAVSPAGDFVVVSEEVQDRLSRMNADGETAWTVRRRVNASAVSSLGKVYALTLSGTIYGDSLLVIDAADGTLLGEYPFPGYDIVIDDARRNIWIVGADIQMINYDMESQFYLDPIAWCASAADLLPDGSIVVTEREHPDVPGSLNRILRVSPGGGMTVLATLDYSPFDVAVSPSGGTFWVTANYAVVNGQAVTPAQGLRLYTESGIPLVALDVGGKAFFAVVDPADGSVWVSSGDPEGVAGNGRITHLASDGLELNRFSGFSGFTFLALAHPR
jgi:hypothetical protein